MKMARRRHRRAKNYKKFPLGQLPNELITSVLSKMRFISFLNMRVCSRWSHDFIEDFRSKINVQYHCKDMSMFPGRINYVWIRSYNLNLPMKELMAIRPKRVTIYGWSQRENEFHYWEPCEIKRAMSDWRKVGWHESELIFNDIRENELLIAFDEILKCGVPLKIEILGYDEVYTVEISRHSVLTMVLSSSLSTEQVCVNYHCEDVTSTMNVIMDGLSGTLLWSNKTQENSILKKKIPYIKNIPREFLYYQFQLADGKVAVLRLYAIWNFHLTFWVFPNEDELFKEIERYLWLIFDTD